MSQIKDFLLENQDNPDAIERYYKNLNTGEKSDFKNVINNLKDDKNSDIWNYWHYKLKLNIKHESHPHDSTGLVKRTNGFSFSNFLFALALSFIGGTIEWAILKNNSDFKGVMAMNLISLTFVSSVVTYMIFIYKNLNKAIKSLPAIIAYLVYLFGGALYNPEGDSENFYLLTLTPVTFIFIGFIITQIFDNSFKNIANNFHSYLQRLIEIFFYSIILSIPIYTTIAVFIGLLNLVDANLSGDFIGWIVIVFGFVTSMTAITFAVDPEGNFVDQKPSALLNLLSGFGAILTFVLVTFISIFILVLLPTGFSGILESGNTSAMFISINLIIFQSIYLASLRIESNSISEKVKANLIVSFFVLIFEGIILNLVALYAIGRRVEGFGFSFERLMVITFILTLFVFLFLKAYALIRFAMHRNLNTFNISNRINNIIFFVVLVVVFFLSTTILDFDGISIRSQFNRSSESEDIVEHMDRSYFAKTPERSVKYLTAKYEDSNQKTKLDIIFVLSNIAVNYSYRYDADERFEIDELVEDSLDKIGRLEDDNKISEIINLVEVYIDSGYSTQSNRLTEICDRIGKLYPKNSKKEVSDFCGVYYFE